MAAGECLPPLSAALAAELSCLHGYQCASPMRKKGKTGTCCPGPPAPVDPTQRQPLATQRQPLAPDGPPDGVMVKGIVPCTANGYDPNGVWWYLSFELSEQRVNELIPDEIVAWDYKASAKKYGWAREMWSWQHGEWHWGLVYCVGIIYAAQCDGVSTTSKIRDLVTDLSDPYPWWVCQALSKITSLSTASAVL